MAAVLHHKRSHSHKYVIDEIHIIWCSVDFVFMRYTNADKMNGTTGMACASFVCVCVVVPVLVLWIVYMCTSADAPYLLQ